MANDTKERILVAALEMFSQNGYAGTNIRELSASLGLVKSGVYKHFESKEAIWNALLDQMITYLRTTLGWQNICRLYAYDDEQNNGYSAVCSSANRSNCCVEIQCTTRLHGSHIRCNSGRTLHPDRKR